MKICRKHLAPPMLPGRRLAVGFRRSTVGVGAAPNGRWDCSHMQNEKFNPQAVNPTRTA